MTDISHSSIADPNIHEPKGVASASSGEVYVANGSGSGAWTSLNKYYALTVELDTVSAASTAYVVAPFAGTITKIYSVIHGAIATANATLTCDIDSVAITGGSITITQSGSSAGDMDVATPTDNNTVTAGSVISVETDGASTNSTRATITFLISHD